MRHKNVLWDGRAVGEDAHGREYVLNGEIRNNFHYPKHK